MKLPSKTVFQEVTCGMEETGLDFVSCDRSIAVKQLPGYQSPTQVPALLVVTARDLGPDDHHELRICDGLIDEGNKNSQRPYIPDWRSSFHRTRQGAAKTVMAQR
jgi:hypothetical protein